MLDLLLSAFTGIPEQIIGDAGDPLLKKTILGGRGGLCHRLAVHCVSHVRGVDVRRGRSRLVALQELLGLPEDRLVVMILLTGTLRGVAHPGA